MTEALETTVWLLTLATIYLFAWQGIMGRQFLATGPFLFLGLQALPAVGLVINASPAERPFDRHWIFMTLLGISMFIVGCLAAGRRSSFSPRDEIRRYRQAPLVDDLAGAGSVFVLLGLVSLSFLAGFLFSSRIGYNTFGSAFQQLLDSGAVDRASISALRAGATREGYAAAGYAAQFTDVILPAAAALMWIRGKVRGRNDLRLAAWGILLLDLMFLTVVGGRKHLVLVALGLGLLGFSRTSPFPRRYTLHGTRALVTIFLLLLGFGFTTILQGRIEVPSTPGGFVSESAVTLYDRIGGNYSKVQLESITLLRDEAPVWGREWLETVRIALPGPTEGLTFDARLHGLLYGSTRGSAPLNVWGSIYYNFGPLGIMMVPLLMGFILQRFTIRQVIRSSRSISRTVLLTMAGFRLALWRDPYSILLEGGLTLIIFLLVHELLRGRRTSQDRVLVAQRPISI